MDQETAIEFQPIDLEHWPRREWFENYLNKLPCTYSMTVKLDITALRGRKLYPTMLHHISTVVNRHPEFRTAFNEGGALGIFEELHPCYTVFHKETETFSNLWTRYTPSLTEFCAAYEQDLAEYGDRPGMIGKPDIPPNSFPVSMLPWTSFESFNLNLQKGYGFLLPIFTMGKRYCENERDLLPLSIQVHHAVCDGFHVCRFVNELQELCSEAESAESSV